MARLRGTLAREVVVSEEGRRRWSMSMLLSMQGRQTVRCVSTLPFLLLQQPAALGG